MEGFDFPDDRPHANIYVNDCDQDVCLSYWLLSEADRVRQLRIEMDIAKLIIFEDFLDATAGAIPVDPITESSETWVTVASDIDQEADISMEAGIADVFSGANGYALDGSSYSEW